MPIWTLDYPRSVAALFDCLRPLPWAAWLDSGDGAGGRYHVLVADPRLRLLLQHGQVQLFDREGKRLNTGKRTLFEVLRTLLSASSGSHGPFFSGGALGYFSYEFGCRLQGLPVDEHHPFPEVALGIYDWAVVVDKQEKRCWLVAHEQGCGPSLALRQRLQQAARVPLDPMPPIAGPTPMCEHSRIRYQADFRRIQNYLREGDCYQINYAQPFSLPYSKSGWPLYLQLRARAQAPFGAFLNYPFAQILSISPELFLQLQARQITTRPIKGTRPRHLRQDEDARLGRELLCSPKDRAENLMIVDLLRNDLGKVCRPGSVRVPRLFELERHARVQHLVSTVQGDLHERHDAIDVLAACFPGGSITGAPKRRAMEIIQELEKRPREIYCGSIGWLGFNGDMVLNIAIRTLSLRCGVATYWAGGGIVVDSIESEEYAECLHKAAAFFDLFS